MYVIDTQNPDKLVRPDEAERDKERYVCKECGEFVSRRSGEEHNKTVAYFTHEQNTHCVVKYVNESDEHREAKLILVKLLNQYSEVFIQGKCNRCDNWFGDRRKIVFENGSIAYTEYGCIDSGKQRRADIACCVSDKIDRIFEIYHTHRAKNYNDIEWYEIEASSILEMQNRCISDEFILEDIKSLCDECLNLPEPSTEPIRNRKGKLYFKQQGAGSGKTFQSIQMIQKYIEDDFSEKTTFIYLTKMHSAKTVIKAELQAQEKNKLLGNLKNMNPDCRQDSNQFVYKYINKKTRKEIVIIIGTIDSFNYAVTSDKNNRSGQDLFEYINEQITQGNIKGDGMFKYAGRYVTLGNDCLVVVDEAQDLPDKYFESLRMLIEKCGVDVYVIGDLLQSIWGENNVFTRINQLVDTNENYTICRKPKTNNVRRFNHPELQNFVNHMVDFEKYDLFPVSVDSVDSSNNYFPYHIFSLPPFGTEEYKHIGDSVDYIIDMMRLEVVQNNYLPEDFLFIFPIISGNRLAERIEIALAQFWIEMFENTPYKTIAIQKNKHLQHKVEKNDYSDMVILHHSDENQPIDLESSKYSTRMVSIHTSKGDGRDVVFLLGFSENILKKFSVDSDNLVYDSLLHVAITRQKRKLYMGIDSIDDNLAKKIKAIPYTIQSSYNETALARIKQYNLDDPHLTKSDEYQEIFKNIIDGCANNEYRQSIPEVDRNRPIIDYGYHVIRYSVMYYNFMLNVVYNDYVNNNYDNREPFLVVLNEKFGISETGKINRPEIVSYEYKEFNQKMFCLQKSTYNNKECYCRGCPSNWKSYVPLLIIRSKHDKVYDYCRNRLKLMIEKIHSKFNLAMRSHSPLPQLCPLESVILLYILDLTKYGVKKITILELYRIMHIYSTCEVDKEHVEKYECLCEVSQSQNVRGEMHGKITNSIKIHFDLIAKTEKIYQIYEKHLKEEYHIDWIKYNLDHKVDYKHGDNSQDEFGLNAKIKIIGYSENTVVIVRLLPKYNVLNFNDVMMDSMIHDFLVKNAKTQWNKKGHNKYENKKVVHCVITLDSDVPIFYEFDSVRINKYVKSYIKMRVIKNSKEFAGDVVDYYFKHLDKENPSFQDIDETLNTVKKNNYIQFRHKKAIDNREIPDSQGIKKKYRLPVEYFDTKCLDAQKKRPKKHEKPKKQEKRNKFVTKMSSRDKILADYEKFIDMKADAYFNDVDTDE